MRIFGITIPDEKRLEVGLTVLYGIGHSRSIEILKRAKVSIDKKAKDLTQDEESLLRQEIEKYRTEGDLRRDISGNIKRLRDIKAYRGSRHQKGLPARGQRTKTNSRTRRGNVRKTMGTGRRAVDKK